MHYYDLDLAAWVRKPGSSAPPTATAVFVVDGIDEFPVQLCRGAETVNPGASAWLAGLKAAGALNAAYLAYDDAPDESGDGVVGFVFDLTTEQAATPFSDGATTQVRCIVQVSWVDSGGKHRITAPLECFLKASYLTETIPMINNTLQILADPDLANLPAAGVIQIYYDTASQTIKARDHNGAQVDIAASGDIIVNSLVVGTGNAPSVTIDGSTFTYRPTGASTPAFVSYLPAISGTITVH